MNQQVVARLRNGLVWFGALLGLVTAAQSPAEAARKAVSATEVNGTFRSADGKTTLMLLSLGRGGFDSPGFGLRMEIRTTVKKGSVPLIFGGYGSIKADQAFASPEETSDRCDLTLTFVKNGALSVKQQGSCDLDRPGTLAGSFRKVATKEPVFTDVASAMNESLVVGFAGGIGSNSYTNSLVGSQVRGYRVELKAGQVLTLAIAPRKVAYMSLFGPTGDLEPDSGGMSEMATKIDVAGVYEVKIQLLAPYNRHYVGYEYSVTIGVENQR